jgi:hypothetical protein
LARYDQALAGSSGQRFVPVGDLTGQIGTWEASNGQNKNALLAGAVQATTSLPPAPTPTGVVVWDSGATLTVALVSAQQALQSLGTAGGQCDGCTPLRVTGARLSTAKIQTTRGPATVPVWEYTLRGTAVRITRVAVDSSAEVTVTPPSWDANNPPAGLSIEAATANGNELTVFFTGAPDPASKPCGADYTAEAVESAHAVVVIVLEHPHAAGGEACTAIGARRSAIATLAAPLGERAVLEVRQGLPVPVTITG